ncbi:MAG: iron-sulfur protein, partial [Actinomycetota bacterium]|nr:iron-sulfur protein [Actinomycetota bacterium]
MATQTDSTTNGDKRLKPHQLSLGLGIGMGAFILLSGVLPQITHWHNENEVHRTVFGNIPGPLQIAFYTLIPVMVVWGAFRFADRMKNWERGAVAKRRTTTKNVKRRAADFRAGVYMR